MAKLTLQHMQKIAAERGGLCISKEYKSNSNYLTWQCSKGHVWENTYAQISVGKWCAQCRLDNRLKVYADYAVTRGGKLLSIKTAPRNRYKWQCAQGHVFIQRFENCDINWCTKCNKQNSDAKWFEKLRAIAAKNNGKLISKTYEGERHHYKYEWQCKNGHRFFLLVHNASKNWYCGQCNNDNWLEKLNSYAKKRGGKLLTKSYSTSDSPYQWQCKNGHVFVESFHYFRKIDWCLTCKKEQRNEKYYKSLHEFARKRGGKCLSKEYITDQTKYTWQCSKGHTWSQAFNDEKRGGWCYKCRREKYGIAYLKKLNQYAAKRGGKIITAVYKDAHQALTWQCARGHEWNRTFTEVKRAGWCPKCMLEKERENYFNKLLSIAKKRGGTCLAKEYTGGDVKIKFKCADDHIWITTPRKIYDGNWCTRCYDEHRSTGFDRGYYHELMTKIKYGFIKEQKEKKILADRKGTIELMQVLAQARKGKCLSGVYKGSTGKLTWQCCKKHEWVNSPTEILAGFWCGKCGLKEKLKRRKKNAIRKNSMKVKV